MKELNLKELETLFQSNKAEYFKIRDLLSLESIFKNDDNKLYLFDNITKSFFRKELKQIVLLLTEYRFFGYKFHCEMEYAEIPDLVVLKLKDDKWEEEQIQEFDIGFDNGFDVLRRINRIIDNREPIDLISYDHQDIKSKSLEISSLMDNEFFRLQVNSVLLFNKLEEKLDNKTFVKKLLKI